MMKLRLASILGVLAIAFITTSCFRPAPVYRLQALNEEGIWDQGRNILTREDSQYKSSVAFEGIEGRYFAFTVFILNKSSQRLDFSTDNVVLVGYRTIPDSTTNNLRTDSIPALDPENTLINLDYAINKVEADKGNANVLNLVETTADLTDDIVNIGNRSREELQADLEKSELRRARYEAEKLAFADKNANLKQQRQYWLSETLRKTTLIQGESTEGLVYLWAGKFKAVELTVQLPDTTHTYLFRQERVR